MHRKSRGQVRHAVCGAAFLLSAAYLLLASVTGSLWRQVCQDKLCTVVDTAAAVEESIETGEWQTPKTAIAVQDIYFQKLIRIEAMLETKTPAMAEAAEVSAFYDEQVQQVVAENKQAEQERIEKERKEKQEQQDGSYLAQSYGRVLIPETGLNMGLTRSSFDNPYLQSLVDAGGAVGFGYNGSYVICAHQNYGFWRMQRSVAGRTVAYIDGKKYLCASIFDGHNNGQILDSNWNMVYYDGIIMYTCNGPDYHNITVSYWKAC